MSVLINENFHCNLWLCICWRNNPIQVFCFGCWALLSSVKWFSVDYMTKKSFVQVSSVKMADKQTIKLNIITPYNLWLSAVLPKVNSLVTQRCETPFRTASAVVWLYLPVLGSETILRSTTICTIMLSKVIKWHIEPRAGEATWSLKVLRWTGAPFFFYPLGWSSPD